MVISRRLQVVRVRIGDLDGGVVLAAIGVPHALRAKAGDHARNSADADRERLAGLAPPLHVGLPAADDAVQHAGVVDELPANSERQVVIDIDHRALTNIVAGLSPLLIVGDEIGLPVTAVVAAQNVVCVIERVGPGIRAQEAQAVAIMLLHRSLQGVVRALARPPHPLGPAEMREGREAVARLAANRNRQRLVGIVVQGHQVASHTAHVAHRCRRPSPEGAFQAQIVLHVVRHGHVRVRSRPRLLDVRESGKVLDSAGRQEP